MSKCEKLWEAISRHEEARFLLSFDEIEALAGLPIDHSFLRYKKGLAAYGFEVEKISMKQRTVTFKKVE